MVDKDVTQSVQALQKLGLPELSVQFSALWALVLEFLQALLVCLFLLTVPAPVFLPMYPCTPGPPPGSQLLIREPLTMCSSSVGS